MKNMKFEKTTTACELHCNGKNVTDRHVQRLRTLQCSVIYIS